MGGWHVANGRFGEVSYHLVFQYFHNDYNSSIFADQTLVKKNNQNSWLFIFFSFALIGVFIM